MKKVFNTEAQRAQSCTEKFSVFLRVTMMKFFGIFNLNIWLLFVFCFLCFGISPAASSTKVDSLKTTLKASMHDTTRIATLTALATEYIATAPDTALLYAEQALSLATVIASSPPFSGDEAIP